MSTVSEQEIQRMRDVRRYFERGCACIASGRLAKSDDGVADEAAVERYERECECTRNYGVK